MAVNEFEMYSEGRTRLTFVFGFCFLLTENFHLARVPSDNDTIHFCLIFSMLLAVTEFILYTLIKSHNIGMLKLFSVTPDNFRQELNYYALTKKIVCRATMVF